MIKLKSIILLSPVLLAGCLSTPNEARNDTPVFSGVSVKSPDKLAECIYEGWTNTRVMLERDNTTHTERLSGKITVFTWRDSMFADIEAISEGSRVSFYKTFSMGYTNTNNRKEIVKSCV